MRRGDARRPTTGRGRRNSCLFLLLGGLLLAGAAVGCSDPDPASSVAPAEMVDGGSWYVRQEWPHDGNPVESERFVVYSDGAGMEERQRLASLAEEVYDEVIEEFGVDPASMFTFPGDQQKVDIYANRFNVLEGGGATAYHAGVLIWSFDNESGQGSSQLPQVRITLKHELVHVVEALLKGRYVGDVPAADPRRMPVWFSEGTAEAMSGGSASGGLRTLDQIDALQDRYGRINPIGWRVDLPPSDEVRDAYRYYYYPMARLAVEYLLDPRGLDRSPEDLAAVMLDIGGAVPFSEAFEAHMGISEADYEDRFFALIDEFLPQSEPPLEAIGVGVAILVGTVLIAGTVALSSQRWPVVAVDAHTADRLAPSRRATAVFRTEVTVSTVLVAGFMVLMLVRLASAELAPGASPRPGYLASAVYVASSLAILAWGIRRWAPRGRWGYLLPALVVVTIITIAVVDAMF